MLEHLRDMQSILEWHKKRGSLLEIEKEVDWRYEMASINKNMEGGPAILFHKIKDYPGVKVASNIFNTREAMAEMLGIEGGVEYTGRHWLEKEKGTEMTPPKIVDNAPCQENVITGKDINILKAMPVPFQGPLDAGRIITSGNGMVKIPETGGFNISFQRMNPRWPNASSINVTPGKHLRDVLLKARKVEHKHVPITVNIGGPPTQIIMAGGGTQSTLQPYGYDELALAGALQGGPMEIVPAKTIEGAWSIANANFVLEGYVDFQQAADECYDGELGKRLFMGEYHGYYGKSWRMFKFVCTGITHRNNPIYYFPLADHLEAVNLCAPYSEAAVYDVCKRIDPTVFDTCYIPSCMRAMQGIAIRVNKNKQRDEGLQTNMMMAALGAQVAFQWVMAVDQDIDITSSDDILWALIFRTDMKDDVTVVSGGRIEEASPSTSHTGIMHKAAFDATIPLENQWSFKRTNFPPIDLEKFVKKEVIDKIRLQQSDYGRMLGTKWTTMEMGPGSSAEATGNKTLDLCSP